MGNYTFCGVDAVELAEKYGTPLYVMSEDEITRRLREIKSCFEGGRADRATFFAAKSFLTKDMLRILTREGAGLDVVSEGELYLAREMAFPPERIAFHGNSKTELEITRGIEYGVGKFVSDSVEEIELIDARARLAGVKAHVLIRVAPGVEGHTHRHISTGGADSKFGLSLSSVTEAISLCGVFKNVSLDGFHFHVGSQCMDNSAHVEALRVILTMMLKLRDTNGFEARTLDMGGGFGVRYTDNDSPQPIAEFICGMTECVGKFCKESGMTMPALIVEPGRWVTAEAGITLYTVGSVKRIPGGRTYIGVDGGFPDNPRPALYDAKYEAVLANKFGVPPEETVTIAGKCCESGDVLIHDIALPRAARGDIIAVLGTGAYNHTMANNYNKNTIPAIVMIKDGKPRLSVRRQSFAAMFAGDI
ncbi:MAG: diaminopimelate decarboxylase [Synergistaceae bacterium]|jgi:diaminopimelate decarboxylase|nr:diaminopimelate decarboxylase [Synergistaceae bacterium]